MRELYISGFDKGIAFLTLVFTAGYAAEFALWDKVQRYITIPERMLIAFLITLSLLIFVGWQIKNQWVYAQQQIDISKIVFAHVEDFEAMIIQYRLTQARNMARFHRQMPVIFGSTVVLAGLAGIVLLIVCVEHLVDA